MAGPTAFVAAPRRTARVGGIMAVADVRDNVDRLAAGIDVNYVSEGCGFAKATRSQCWGDTTGGDSPKTYDGIENGASVIQSIIGYFGVKCFLEADEGAEEKRRATAGLDAGEGRFIEAALIDWLDAAPAVTGAATLGETIGLLEDRADAPDADGYIGRPVLWLNRADAVLAFEASVLVAGPAGSGELWTPNGTPVIATAAVAPGDVYLTGDITVLRSVVTTNIALNPTVNQQMAIAERGYTVLVDCDYRAKSTVTA